MRVVLDMACAGGARARGHEPEDRPSFGRTLQPALGSLTAQFGATSARCVPWPCHTTMAHDHQQPRVYVR